MAAALVPAAPAGAIIGGTPDTVNTYVGQRMSTTAPLKGVQSEVVAHQHSAEGSRDGGGSCFGDSGGGAFRNQYVLGDASYVNSLTCNATGTYQRADTAYSQAFLKFWIAQAG